MGTTRPGYTDHGSRDDNTDDDTADTCAATVDWCHCTLPAHLDGPHACDCGGSWEWTETGRFIVHAWPS